ncbi:MAG: hypothetical protein GXP53_09240, partial [Deltaproteobacteria bacterium]|nr:hypothetical protein [Deltaproteobacteria bacterium]
MIIKAKSFFFKIWLGIFMALLVFMTSAHAASPGDVVITEIAWMGTEAATVSEWIELYNTTSASITLTNWTLVATSGTPNITLSGSIAANGYFLLERVGDDTIDNLTADQIYTGALVDTGDTLTLSDTTPTTIDTANSDGGVWPAGTNTPKATMERIGPFLPDADANWQTSTGNANNARDRGGDLITGTPKAASSPSGSGRALNFDGVDDHVVVTDAASLDLSTTGTMEAWIHVNSFLDDGGIIHKGDVADSSDAAYELKLGTTGANTTLVFTVYDATGTPYSVSSVTTLDIYKWWHVAAVWDSAVPSMTLYINGISDVTGTTAAARATTGDLHMGSRFTAGADPFNGDIDEVRIWNIARTEAQIRTDMCQKLAGNETGLVAYWRFDKADTTTCPDFTGNAHTGTMTNMDAATDRVSSDAALGDASLYDYTGTAAANFSVVLTHPDGDSLTVTGDGGTWDDSTAPKSGLQVYRVDSTPSVLDISVYWNLYKKASHYWGVFVTGGTNPTYSVVYDYSGLSDITNESQLRFGIRHKTSDGWLDIGVDPNTTTNTFTQTGLSGTQFLLGSLVDPRNAILFTAANSEFVQVPYAASLDATIGGTNNAVTVEAWVKKTSAQAGQIAIVQMDASYNLHFTAGNQPEFTIIDTTLTAHTATFATSLTNGQWYHLAGTFDGTTIAVHVDGYSRAS